MSDKKELTLATYWQTQMSLYNGTALLPLTFREIGQINTLWRKTGMLSKRMITFAFRHWAQFTADVMSTTGSTTCPKHPHIGYLLAHRDIAVSLMVKLNIVDEEEAQLALEVVQILD